MPYIAFDLDALSRAPAVARASSIPEDHVISGLVRLWAWCFKEKVDKANTMQVRGHFAGDCISALEAYGFLEKIGEDWRIRGASRYLRINEGRIKGGLAAKKHLIPGARQKRVSPEESPEAAEEQPRPLLGSSPEALSASTGLLHRAPSTESLKDIRRSEETGPTEMGSTDLFGKHPEAFEADRRNAAETRIVRQVTDAWNAMAEPHRLSKVAKLGGKRLNQLRARLKENREVEFWLKAIAEVPKNPWNLAKHPRNTTWRATFDWLIKPGKAQELFESAAVEAKPAAPTYEQIVAAHAAHDALMEARSREARNARQPG